MRKSFWIPLAFLLLTACQNQEKPKTRPLTFEKETLVKKAGENCDTADYDCTIISLEVVKATGPTEISRTINDALRIHAIRLISPEENPRVSTLDELADRFISDYKTAAKDFSQEPPWEAYLNESIYYKDSNLVSVGVTTEIFSGGAHGYKSLTFLNFDPKTGEPLHWKDIFTVEFKDFIEKKFRAEQQIPDEAPINSTGFWFENNRFQLPENIGFTEENMILIYNAYEIAPYAAGDFYMEIPLEEVSPFRKNQ